MSTLDTMVNNSADPNADATVGPPVSISVPEWNVSLLAGVLLTEQIGPDDGVQAVFELRVKPTELNALFVWDHSNTTASSVEFSPTAKTLFKGYCRRQLYLPDGSTTNRSDIAPSLATHFLLNKSLLKLSTAMDSTGLLKCNMVEEKILSVAHDLFNSTSAFTLFEPKSRILLAQDYYTRGAKALDYIADKMESNTTAGNKLATSIVTKVLSTRAMPTDNSSFTVFLSGDELTFNVVAVSSKSQYDITPSSNVDKNLSDRSYKFKIVVVDESTNFTSSPFRGVAVLLNSVPVMGDVASEYETKILSKITTPLAFSNDPTSYLHYVDRFNTDTTNAYTAASLSDGTQQF